MATPSQIILMRHAEKPDFKSEILSEKGFQRAQALAHLFEIYPALAVNGVPDFLIAAKYVPGQSSRRSHQTLEPLGLKLNLAIQGEFLTEEFAKLASDLLQNPQYEKKSIVIAWTHTYITKLANALGVGAAPDWDSSVFDRLWLIQFDLNGKLTFSNLGQKLLPGDSID